MENFTKSCKLQNLKIGQIDFDLGKMQNNQLAPSLRIHPI